MAMTRINNKPSSVASARRSSQSEPAQCEAHQPPQKSCFGVAFAGGRLGVVVRRQVPLLEHFIADFLAPAQRLVIEVDGPYPDDHLYSSIQDMDAIGATSRWVAAARAVETERADRLFEDPWARRLAGEEGFALLEDFARVTRTTDNSYLAIRTRFLDDFALASMSTLRQVVVLAAGMDARAFRLPWPAGTTLYEVEREQVLAVKEPILRAGMAVPRCDRRLVPIDLADAWESALAAAGFHPDQPALFLVEGIVPYLTADQAESLMQRVGLLAAPESKLGADMIGSSFLESAWTAALRARLEELGIGWHFGTDEPERWLAPFGWATTATLLGEPDANWGRWPYPVLPRSVPGFPKSYLVRATRVGGESATRYSSV